MQMNLARIRQFGLALAVLAAVTIPALAVAAQVDKLAPAGAASKRVGVNGQAVEMERVAPDPAYMLVASPAVKSAPVVNAVKPIAANLISGLKNIPGDYATLALAITDLNAQGVGAGGVTLNLLAGNPQTAPAGGYVIGNAGSLVLTTASAANPIIIKGNGNTITAFTPQTVASVNDAIFKLIGADFTTITGFTMRENPANVISATALTNNMTEFGVALFYVTATDGAQNNIISANTITLDRTYRNTFGIYSNTRTTAAAVTTLAEATAASGSNSNNKVYGNNISNMQFPICFVGVGAVANIAAIDTGNDIGGSSAATGNVISNWGNNLTTLSTYISVTGSIAGIFVNQQINDNVSFNTVTSASLATTTVQLLGIFKNYSVANPAAATVTTTNLNNNTVTLTDATTTAQVTGISWQGMTALATATINVKNNLIANCAVTGGTTSSILGLFGTSAPGTLTITGNTVRGLSSSSTTTGALVGIQQQTNAVVNTLTIDNNKIGDATAGAFTNTAAANTGGMSGIIVTSTGAAATCATSIQNNDLRGFVHTNVGTGQYTGISNAGPSLSQNISGNTFTNLNCNTTGSVILMSDGASLSAAGSKTINNNSIVGTLNKAGGAASLIFYNDLGLTSPNGSTSTASGNNFSNVTTSGTVAIAGWNNQDGNSGTDGPTKTFTNNTFNNIVHNGTGVVNVVFFDYGGLTTGNITGNTITNITGQSTVGALNIGSTTAGAGITENATSNIINNLSSTGAGGQVSGIIFSSPGAHNGAISQNTVNTLSSSSATTLVAGLAVLSGGTVSVSKNKIYGLSTSTTAVLTGLVNGILLQGGTTVTATNNLVGGLTAPASASTDAVRGISVTSATALTTYNVYYNSIHMSGGSSGANFGATGIFHAASAVATTAALNLRNNIVANLTTPSGTGLAVAYRLSGTALGNYANTSNRNLFYAGTPGASNLIFNDGVNSDQTLAAYKARVAGIPADANSVTENPPFLSTSGPSANFLHIDPSIGTQIEGGASPVAGVTDDFDGVIRNVSTPDIGADEGNFTGPFVTITASAGAGGTISPSGAVSVSLGANQTFTITPDACHTIADVLVDGVSQGAVATYTFTNVTVAHTIAASFNLINYTINSSAAAGGSITPNGATTVGCGASQTYAIAADGCHTILDVTVDGGSVGAVASYTFTNVTANHTISAAFSLNSYNITASAGPGGSISPIGVTPVSCAGSQAYSISANSCFVIADVLVDGVSQGAISSYTFSNVTADHTIAASFTAAAPSTITATASAGGSISPSGAVSVSCGGSQSFTSTPASGYYFSGLVVDGGAVSPVSPYTFTNVTANHTIAASFTLDVSTIAAGPASGLICPTNTCVSLPVTLSRLGNTPVLAYSVTFQLSPELALCAGTSSVSEGSFLSGTGTTLFQVTDNGGGSYTVDGALINNCGPTATSGSLFTMAVSSSSPSGPGTVTIGTLKLRDCANQDLATLAGPPALVQIDNAAPVVAVTSPNGGEVWIVGASQNITWTATDNVGVANVDIDYSTDGGATYPNSIATAIANSGTYAWVVPNTPGTLTRVRVTAHDVNCSSGSDASDANFTISPPSVTITASAGAGGSISPSGAVSVVSGGNQSFSISADPCYSIADVLVDGVSVGAVSSYTFINVTSARTIAASFVINTFTITASAGVGGSISPSGAVSVNCGSDQTFSIAAASCYSISDVLVDGGSVGAVSTYTFTNVTAAHTIAASFSLNTYTITASAGAGGTISPSGAVAVNCGDNQSFSISVVGCNSIADVLVDGVSVGAVSSYTFLSVQANHTIAASFTVGSQSIVASAGSGGSISPSGTVLVTCGNNQSFSITAAACNHILDVLVDGVSVGAVASYTFINVQASHTIAATFAPTVSPVAAATGVTATQLKVGNDTDGTTKITIAYSAPGAASVEVWRKGFGGYPTYDNAGGSVPPAPGAYPPAGWTLTGVSASGQTDEPAARDFWYYVAYAKDACGNVSPVSNITSGTLDYHLGDVSNGITLGQGDNTVATADVSLLGAHYGLTGGALTGFEYLDVGPTTLINPNGRPTTDSKTNFEDLVIFALNYTPQVSAVAKLPVTSSIGVNEVAAEGPASVEAGQEFDVAINLSGAGNLQAASVGLKWDATIVEPIGMTGGDWVSERGGVVFSAAAGSVDAALLGKADQGFVGQGVLATVRFRSIAKGAPAIGVATVIGRDNLNQAVKVAIGTSAAPVLPGRATLTQLQPVRPNPAPGRATIGYSLVKQGNVDLAIFSVDGRLVKSLARGTQDAGSYRITWDGVDDRGSVAKSGVYFVRFHAPGVQQTRVLNLVR